MGAIQVRRHGFYDVASVATGTLFAICRHSHPPQPLDVWRNRHRKFELEICTHDRVVGSSGYEVFHFQSIRKSETEPCVLPIADLSTRIKNR